MISAESTVFVIDDDESVRDALSNLLESVGLRTKMFASTEDFVRASQPKAPGCLVLDIRLPGTNGLEFQEQLKQRGIEIPIIFITAHGDIPMTKRAMRAGAIEFLTKPFEKEDLLSAIENGFSLDRAQREEQAEISTLQAHHADLTAREREVMALVVTGLINKQIAAQLGLSEVTVKIHRSRVMQKMHAASLADLVRAADRLKARVK